MKTIRVILADDHAMVREGLRTLINGQPDMRVIAEAANGKEVLRAVEEATPDLVLMDLTMPELNGLQATETLKARHIGIKVIALTMHEDVSYMRQMIKAGANGYVVKSSPGDQLIRAIHIVAQGGVYFDETLAGKALTGHGAAIALDGGPSSAELSAQEEKVLTLLAWGHSNKEIANDLGLSPKTVETYKVRLKEKLGLRSRAEMVQYALRQGWFTEAQPHV